MLSNLASAREEVGRMSAMVDSLHTQIDKEQAISVELSAKCEQLKKEVEKKEQQLELQQNETVYIEPKINQEVASAAVKLAECQKTIASLGNQLKSLAPNIFVLGVSQDASQDDLKKAYKKAAIKTHPVN